MLLPVASAVWLPAPDLSHPDLVPPPQVGVGQLLVTIAVSVLFAVLGAAAGPGAGAGPGGRQHRRGRLDGPEAVAVQLTLPRGLLGPRPRPCGRRMIRRGHRAVRCRRGRPRGSGSAAARRAAQAPGRRARMGCQSSATVSGAPRHSRPSGWCRTAVISSWVGGWVFPRR